jgi:hypothetical protein
MTPTERHKRFSRESIHVYGSIILATVGFVLSLAVAILPHTGLAEQSKEFVTRSSELLFPIGVAIGSFFFLQLVFGHREVTSELERLRRLIEDPESPEWVNRMKESLPELLREAFTEDIKIFCDGLKRARTEHQIVLDCRTLEARFASAYRTTLRRFPKGEFWATALATRTYWGFSDKPTDLSVEQPEPGSFASLEVAFREFIGTGGVMHRLFFVVDPDKLTVEECEIILRQRRLGVVSHILNSEWAEANDLLYFFVVEKGGAIAWEASISQGASRKVSKVTATVDSVRIQETYLVWRKKLFEEAREISLPELEQALAAAQDRRKKKKAP